MKKKWIKFYRDGKENCGVRKQNGQVLSLTHYLREFQ